MHINHGHILPFDGDAEKLQLWWRKFKAFAVFKESLEESIVPKMPGSSMDTCFTMALRSMTRE
jgi:hypothetical protein